VSAVAGAVLPWSSAPRAARRASLPWLALAIALHVLAVVALWQRHVALPPREDASAITFLRLMVEPAPAPRDRPSASRPVPSRDARPRRHSAPPSPTLILPSLPTAPHDTSAPTPDTQRPLPITPPLNLRLPDTAASAPPTMGSQAINDPRVVTRRSFSERFAATLGTDLTIHEDRLNDGSMRVRQGTSCAIVKESAAARLDPFTQSGAPKLVGECPH
jgi:hypothetical protein